MAMLQRVGAQFAACLFCFFCYLASHSLRGENEWLRHGRAAQATVTDKYTDEGSKTTAYRVAFVFDCPDGASGQTPEAGTFDVDADEYARTNRGDLLPIYYKTNDPSDWRRSEVTKESVGILQASWHFAIGGWVIVAAIGLGSLKRYRNKRLRLLRDGRATVATVTGQKTTTTSEVQRSRTLMYGWTDHLDRVRRKAITVSAEQSDRYQPSSQFTVLCDPDDVFNSVPYFRLTEAVVEG